ncbi:uncharacterized protein N7496_004334 [Penicillium cataractarum]|uniref:DUF1996 domain-containing protein n=1 Tax=Penicillium cataractarum TaxID=2100454 RepID=A0A9W9SNY3_9EURO|nr:uncharacterized protein N7496_004334 [Penicillium cataractarum]KAJ5381906.1 hypothetical protein N7496_004334 [Penicillium cataractarum]
MQDIRLTAALVACLTLFPAFTSAFWRLPCRGRTGVARLDPIVDPGEISSHVHAIHGGGSFSMNSNMQTLRESSCTSCAVTQDLSAYWTPALYFMHTNGSAELVEEVGGMLAYYLLYGDNVTAFPDGFRMLAGDPFQRNFTWPVPDPPKSSWSGAQVSQKALRQKALGFNCLDYAGTAEASLYRHFMPNKTFLDANCPDGLRLELMFPSCWNGKDVDSSDHKSHVAYPDLVITGTCPEGYETRLVSLFYETIWNTYAFKDVDGYFALANGDPTGYGYHGDFMYAWEDGVLQEAIDTCTSESGEVSACEIFDIQSETEERECFLDLPSELKNENVQMHADGLPGPMGMQWGPAYATMGSASSSSSSSSTSTPTSAASVSVGATIDVGNVLAINTAVTTTSSTTSTSSPTPTPTTSIQVDQYTEEIVYLQQEVIVMLGEGGVPYATSTGTQRTLSTALTTATQTSTVVSYVEKRDETPAEPEKRDLSAEKEARHAHNHHRHSHKRHGH